VKILIINPNSDDSMSKNILESAENFAGGDFAIACLSTPGAPAFIETYHDQMQAAPGMFQLIKDYENTVDGFIVACHCDPNLDLLKEATPKPVVGIGEASMKMASMLGHRFSVIAATNHSIPSKEALIEKYHLTPFLASIRAPEPGPKDLLNREMYLKISKQAIEEDMAEVIVLGCAGFAGLDRYIQQNLKIPVLDPTICALIIVSGLAKTNISTSKIRRYNPHD